MKGDVSFVASIIYAALVMLGIAAIAGGVLSVFNSPGSFEGDADSFSRWIGTGSEDAYTVSIGENEGFVLGYRRDCTEMFERLDARCADDELCYCLARKDDDTIDEVRCVAAYSGRSVRGVDEVTSVGSSDEPGGCASSHISDWWSFNRNNDRNGVYVFELNVETNTINVSVTR